MKKRRIVIASILKPVDDTRMLAKMGRTLQASGHYDVFIIGYPSQRQPEAENISLIPLKEFKRLSIARLTAPFKILLSIIKVKPGILIVNTHELLIVAILNRIFFGTRIYYDVRENYYRNLRYANTFPPLLRIVLAVWVRAKEKLAAPFFHGFFLAEKGYQNEMNYFRRRDLVIENKAAVVNKPRTSVPGLITLLFTGTLAESTGIFEAIRLAKLLHALTPLIRLRIAGSCAVNETMRQIDSEIHGLEWITLAGGPTLVPHDDIINAIFSSDFGIICYPPSPHIENSIPTKLYEYLSYSLPILLQNNAGWVDLCAPLNSCIPVDFTNLNVNDLLKKMQERKFYTTATTGTTWESEGKKLLDALNTW